MKLYSTNGNAPLADLKKAVVKGLAEDKGLYMPCEIKKLPAAFFENIHSDAVYASDLLRAFNTAKAVADSKGLTVTPEKNLREIYAGRWEKMAFADIPLSSPELWSNWQNANVPDLRAPEGESFSELLEREIGRAHV